MNSQQWFQTPEFADLWKRSFADVHAPLADAHKSCEKPRAYAEKRSLWLEIREPIAGFRLISVELPTHTHPPRLYLRTWTYEPHGRDAHTVLAQRRFAVDGKKAGRYLDEVPRDSWRSQLDRDGIQVHGIRDYVDLTTLGSLPNEQAAQEVRRIVSLFCEHIASAVSVPVSPQIVTEDLDASEIDFAVVSLDPRFINEPPPMRRALANARVGQGGYRQRMLVLWGRQCALTGCDVEAVLVSSHARAWSCCDTAGECLDEYNGLLLTATLDRLFDQGLIAFTDEGKVLVKGGPAIEALVAVPSLRFVSQRHLPYFAWHRQRFGFDQASVAAGQQLIGES